MGERASGIIWRQVSARLAREVAVRTHASLVLRAVKGTGEMH